MNTLEKLAVLGSGAKYDTSCGGDERKKHPEKPVYGIYNAIAYGKCVPLLKVLVTNRCIHDCRYCVNTCGNRIKADFELRELAGVFGNFLRKGYIEGMFLSSAVCGDPDSSGEKIIEAAEIVRKEMKFRGYIHLKALPGMSRENLERMCMLADRVSINIEAPSSGRLNELSSTKEFGTDIMRRMEWLSEMKKTGKLANFTTQFVVGANGESDLEYMQMCRRLYMGFGLWRAYFSSFSPVKGTGLEAMPAENPAREHALYQADWLYRVYGFRFFELEALAGKSGNFPLGKDLKLELANANPSLYPIDVNSAPFSELIRVPGIGPKSAENLLRKRNSGKRISGLGELRSLGVVVKRASNFIEMDGFGKQCRLFEF